MVRGIEVFKEYFKGLEEKYILIGGAACDSMFSEFGETFRATKDLDIILIVEALDKQFFGVFWNFIKKGGYGKNQINEDDKKYYRFKEPEDLKFPFQLELFSRKPDAIELPEGMHLTPIPADEKYSSLSAILLDDDYYDFIISNCSMIDGIKTANISSLICLKANAYFELKQRKEKGENVSQDDINKHMKDIIRLTSLITERDKVLPPDKIKMVIRQFVEELKAKPTDYKGIGKTVKRKAFRASVNQNDVVDRLKTTFQLN